MKIKKGLKILLVTLLSLSLVLSAVSCGQTDTAEETVEETAVETEVEPETPETELDPTEDQTIDTEILVVGGGGAGLAAALTAAQEGADVVLIEKLGRLGGSTALSSGLIIHATGEDDDSGEPPYTAEQFEDLIMGRGEGHPDPELVKKITETSNDVVEWIKSFGYELNEHTLTIYPEYDPIRLSNPDPDGAFARTSGMMITDLLAEEAEKLGVNIITQVWATELLVDADNNVVGAMATNNDHASITINSDAVILATGSYDHNEEMIAEYAPESIGVDTVTSAGNTGDGVNMAVAIGADTVFHGDGGAQGTVRVETPTPGNFLCINDSGERFMREDSFYADAYMAMVTNENDNFFRVFDANLAQDKLDDAVEEGLAIKADTLEELANDMGVDQDTFHATVERYNSLNGQEDTDFGKATELMTGLETAPFYAVKAEPEILLTIGGIKINTDTEVLNTDGDVIANLYAAGDNANGDFLYKAYIYSGSAVQFAINTGRIAGETAAKNLA